MTTTPLPLSSDDKLWVILCHLSLFLGVGLIVPLIVYLVKKADSTAVALHAKEALNFHISLYIYAFVLIVLGFVLIVPFFLLPFVGLLGVICSIIAAVKASNGELYLYPLTIRLVS